MDIVAYGVLGLLVGLFLGVFFVFMKYTLQDMRVEKKRHQKWLAEHYAYVKEMRQSRWSKCYAFIDIEQPDGTTKHWFITFNVPLEDEWLYY